MVKRRAKWRTEAKSTFEALDDGFACRLSIPIITPSLNAMGGKAGSFRRSRIRKEAERCMLDALLVWQARGGGEIKRVTAKRRVSFISYRRRLLDHDNLIGGLKPVLDALRDVGLIRDDSPEWVELHYRQVKIKAPETPRTEIIVQSV